ncbi:MAG: hydrolase [Betaproteobacteria bacterium RIFCSPLOWO2_12_FULL_63_13]|nr:MAG: hydrolase [Betaproteobacteria bacterium RIFCSPLOWO2_02_FULL_63_19]OGA52562.1 MAG: hydrolase [Betaproteobacteria bacterium RIFCSPLOWO2_12_FULL_63_13]
MKRRAFLASPMLLLTALPVAAETVYAQVRAGRPLVFPRDHGSHPDYRTEWWYITGWLRSEKGEELGVQITFFRNRPGFGGQNPSRFAPRQLLFAHAALSDPRVGRLLHDQRAARAGFGLADASRTDTDVHVLDWSLARHGGEYEAHIVASEFDYALKFRPAQPLLLQGEAGFSRKGPDAGQASYYYSRPHMQVSGIVTVKGRKSAVTGSTWLDHEWSSQALAPEAAGWDWVGLNLVDGGALMAFRIRDRRAGLFWAGGTHRDGTGRVRVLRPGEIDFTPLRHWRSPRTQIEYPVMMRIKAGNIELVLGPSMDDQELDARASTGTIYWEGAVRAHERTRLAGRGYLELTGYWKPLKL